MTDYALFMYTSIHIFTHFRGVCTVVPCVLSDKSATGSSCKCALSASTNECDDKKFCWTDNTCNDAMKPGEWEL